MNADGGRGDTGTGRLSTNPDDVDYRIGRQEGARKNLAAMVCDRYGVDTTRDTTTDLRVRLAAAEYQELVAVLGLDNQAQRKPGCCAWCEQPLTITSAAGYGIKKSDLCVDCRAAGEMP